MKKLILASVISMIALVGFASGPYAPISSLQININEYGPYTVEVNGHAYAAQNNTVRLNRLTPGSYRVRIVRNVLRRGYHRPMPRVVYDNYIQVPPRSNVTANYNRFGMQVNRVVNHPRIHPPVNRPTVIREPDYGKPHHRAHRPITSMHPQDFNQLLRTIDNTSFDQTRMSIAKSAMAQHQMSTAQIAEVMQRFSFDSHRLEFAKFAYASCIDPQNYYQLSNQFSFESNARSLMNFIS